MDALQMFYWVTYFLGTVCQLIDRLWLSIESFVVSCLSCVSDLCVSVPVTARIARSGTQCPSIISSASFRFALLMGGDVTGNLGGAVETDLLRVLRILLSDYQIPAANIFVVAQTTSPSFLQQVTAMGVSPVKPMTKRNLTVAINTIVAAIQSVSSKKSYLHIHYSGHGLQVPDNNHDEEDGMDEAICVDRNEIMTDDEFSALLFQRLPVTNSSIFFMDQCHSGSFGDLDYMYRVNESRWVRTRQSAAPVRARVYTVSACADNQLDYQQQYQDRSEGGLLSVLFVEGTVAQGIAYRHMLDRMDLLATALTRDNRVGGAVALQNIEVRSSFAHQ